MCSLAVHGGAPACGASFPEWPVRGGEEEDALLRVVRSGVWGSQAGAEVSGFEAAFAGLQGARYGVGVSCGTVAIRIALLAAGVQAGDEVLVPAYTFQATATAVVEANARPVFVDVDPRTYTMCPKAAKAAVTSRTRFILPVHFAGLPADMDALVALADRRGLTLIEDAAQAHGAAHAGHGVGSIGAMGCFSFQSSKNVNCAEGGMVLTDDDRLAAKCRAIRNCGRGMEDDGAFLTVAGNYRMTEFQGAVGRVQLSRHGKQAAVREANAARLGGLLSEVPGIAPQARPDYATRHAYHLYSFRYDEDVWGASRAAFIRALNAEGVPATPGYTTPLYRQPMFAQQAYGPYSGAAGDPEAFRERCPVTERACSREGAWIYQRALLGAPEDMEAVAGAFHKLWRHRDELRKVEM